MARVADPAHDPGVDDVEPDSAVGKRALHPAHPAAEPTDVLLCELSMGRKDPIAQEPHALIARKDYALVLVDLKTQRFQEALDLQTHLMQPPLVVGEDQEVIDVTDVAHPEPVGHIMIERIEVDVGEELARLVAQRQPSAPLDGSEQVVAGEPRQHRVLGIAVVDDQPDQPEEVRVFDLAGDKAPEDLVVDGGEELADVGLQDILVPPGERAFAVSALRALAVSA
jgi:hypothetical protein